MIAHERTVDEIAAEIGADSLAYLSLDGVYEAVGTPREVHCDACFTGDYPLGDGGEGERQVRARGAARRPGPGGESPAVGHHHRWLTMRDAALQLLGHAGVPARAARGGRGRGRRPRRAAGDADRRRQVALLPAPGDPRPRLAVVVSPLVSLMIDQVESLGGRAELINAQRDARRQPPGARARDRRRGARLLYVAPGALRDPGLRRPAARGGDRALRRRRGPLREPVGPRLPARLLPPRRRRAGARRALDLRRDRDRDAAGRRRRRPAARASRPGADHDRLRPPEPLLRRGPGRLRAREAARRRWRCSREPDALPAIVYAGHPQEDRGDGRVARARARPPGARLPRGDGARAARRGAARVHVRRDAGRGRDERLRHGRRQGRRAHGHPRGGARPRSRPTTRRPGAAGATGCRRAACCWPRTATRACTCSSSTRSTTRRPRTIAGASTARSGASSRARRCRREAILRHFGDRAEPRAPTGAAATSATGRSQVARSPSAGASRSRRRELADLDRRDPRRRRRGRAERSDGRGRSRSCAAGAARCCVKYAYDALPGYGDFARLARRRRARARSTR